MSPSRSLGSFRSKGFTHQHQSPSRYAEFSYIWNNISPAALLPTQGEPLRIISFCINFSFK